MSNPKDEADVIIDLLFEDYGTGGYTRGEVPYWVDGKEAIKEMRAADYPRWQEVEWAGYYIKYLIQKSIEAKSEGKIRGRMQQKWHFFSGDYIWDVRFHADGDKVILGDVDGYLEVTEKNNGIGVLIVDALAGPDWNREFRDWHEEFKGGPSQYTSERERDGRPVRIRKFNFFIKKILSYYFPYGDFQRGIEDGWVKTFQEGMRNANGSPRNPKYRLIPHKIPEEYLLTIRNFNEDPDEFREDYPQFAD